MTKRKGVGYWIVLIGISFLVAMFLTLVLQSCNSVKQVLADPGKMEVVGRQWEKSNPCVTSKPELIKGKDSVILDTLNNDEAVSFLNEQIDSLLLIKCRDISPLDLDSLKKQIAKQLKTKCNPIVHWHTRVDTLPVEDTRRLRIANDSLSYYKGRYAELQLQLTAAKKTSTKKTWWIVGLVLVIGLGTFLRIKRII